MNVFIIQNPKNCMGTNGNPYNSDYHVYILYVYKYNYIYTIKIYIQTK